MSATAIHTSDVEFDNERDEGRRDKVVEEDECEYFRGVTLLEFVVRFEVRFRARVQCVLLKEILFHHKDDFKHERRNSHVELDEWFTAWFDNWIRVKVHSKVDQRVDHNDIYD